MPQPVVNFLRYSLTLKAAIAECADTPDPKPVHRLRSTTRRMEAVLELLGELFANSTDLPKGRRKQRSFRRYLRKIRRAAGAVRDVDVHLEILETYQVIRDTAVLEKDLKVARRKLAKRLQQRIMKDERDLRRALDELEAVLAPFADLDWTGGALAHAAQEWLATAVHGLDPQQDDDLHSIRKACKTARYIAEIGGETSKAATKLAERFEAIQQTTGAWHDYLLLLNEAHAALPEDSPLVEKIRAKAFRLWRKAELRARPLHTMNRLVTTRGRI
ncbi:MAG TPA: CHAD domain-containing protein [Acidobacteriaceae bacterium]